MSLDIKVEIAFATDPDAVTPTWVDVSAYVDLVPGVEVRRGAGEEYSEIQPGTLRLTLDNSDGRFTPSYSGSPYYPNVKIGRRVRASMSLDGGAWVTRFDGFVDAWPMQWAPGAFDAEAGLTATDRFKRLSRHVFTENVISAVIKADSPLDYWTFGDPAGTTTPRNEIAGGGRLTQSSDGSFGVATQTITYGDGTGPATDGLTAVQISQTGFAGTRTRRFDSTHSLTFETFVRLDGASILFDDVYPFRTTSDTSTDALLVSCSLADGTDDDLRVTYTRGSDGTDFTATCEASLFDGDTHHIAVVCDGPNGTLTAYVDGVAGTPTAVTFSSPTTMRAGTFCDQALCTSDPAPVGTWAHMALYDTALSATRIAAHVRAGGLLDSTLESSLDRFDRIVDLAGVTDTATVGTAGSTDLSPLSDITGKSVTVLLNDAARTENGRVYIDTDGALTFSTRLAGYNQAAVATLAAGEYGSDLTFTLDDFGMFNDFTTTSGNGTIARYVDDDSVTAYGTYSDQMDLGTLDDNEAESYAAMRVVTSQPEPRISQVTVDLLTQESLTADFWAQELIGALITLSGLPSTAPASSVTLEIQGYTESYSTNDYSLTLSTSPAPLGVWKLGDATLGVLGSTTRLAY